MSVQDETDMLLVLVCINSTLDFHDLKRLCVRWMK